MAGTIEKSLLAVALLGIVLPHIGWAHGPSRQKITETIQIDAPPAKMWGTIADFHDMSWLPGVAKTSGEGGNEPDAAKRQLTLDGGATIDESLYKYDAGAMSYSYRIDKVDVKVLPVNNYSSTIAVLPPRAAKAPSNGAAPFTGAIPTTIRRPN
jgi:hypothetical protein